MAQYKTGQYESIYDPTRLGDGGEISQSTGKVTQNGEHTQLQLTPGLGNTQGSVPYDQVAGEYRDAAVQSGLPRAAAYRWAAAAMAGSARMVLETGKHPGELKDLVTSPAGTTIEGVAVLEREGFRSAVIDAMGAVTRRAREIGRNA